MNIKIDKINELLRFKSSKFNHKQDNFMLN